MGTVAVKFKLMPSSPNVDFKEIKNNVWKILEEEDVKYHSFEEELIAFGLKALIVIFGWPEEKELEKLEEKWVVVNPSEQESSEEPAALRMGAVRFYSIEIID